MNIWSGTCIYKLIQCWAKFVGPKSWRKKRSIERGGILSWHKVLGNTKGFRDWVVLLPHTEQGNSLWRFFGSEQRMSGALCLRVWAEISSESRKNDKSRFPLSTYFKAHTGSGGMDQQQLVRSQTPSDEVAGGLENLWQKFSNIPWITWENASSQFFESSHVGWISFKMMDPLPYVWEISKSSRLQKSASPQMILALLFPQTQGCQKRKGRRGKNERNSNLGWAPLKSLSKGTLVSYFCSWDNHLP